MAIEGDLKDIGLTSVVQIMCIERRKAGLIVRRRGEEGVLFFDNGEIVHAAVGPQQGEEAVYQLLTWTDGTFRMSEQVTTPVKTIKMSWNNLLLEGMRRIDEQSRETEAPAPDDSSLSPADIAQDGAFENELILLLSELEQIIARLGERKMQKRAPLALQSLAELANKVIAFSENVPKADATQGSLVKTLIKTHDAYPQARLLQAEYNHLSVQTILNLHNSWSGDPRDRRYMFRQISRGIVHVVESYFSFFATNFRAVAMREQWRETYDVFISDLTRALDKVEF